MQQVFFAVNNSTTIAEGEGYNSPSGVPTCHSVFSFSTSGEVTIDGVDKFSAIVDADCRHSGMYYYVPQKDLGNFDTWALAKAAINKYLNELRVEMEDLCTSCKS